jgi:putative chitinase
MTFNRTVFFGATHAHFGSLQQSQVDGFETIISAFEKTGNADPRHLAYCLATAWHETARTMQPIREYGRGRGKRYGAPVHGKVYYGRGFVQLTWDYNYKKAGAKLNVDLLNDPDLALEPAIAGSIMCQGMAEGWFTGRKLSDYFNAKVNSPVGARRIINGNDRAQLIAGYHRVFLAALRPVAVVTVPKIPLAPKTGIVAKVKSLLKKG